MPARDRDGNIFEKPTKLSTTNRYTFDSVEESLPFINAYNGKVNTLSISVNPYLEMDGGSRPNYDTIYVKRLYFDLDEPRMDDVRKLSNYFNEYDIMHQLRFSGRGFHVLPTVCNLTESVNEAMMLIQEMLQRKLGITFCTDSDTGYCRKDKMVRIPNTYNRKRRRYCIPLNRDDLNLSYNEIREMARCQRFITPIIGSKFWDLSGYNNSRGFRKTPRDVTKHLNNIVPIHITKALSSVGLEYDDLCPAINFS